MYNGQREGTVPVRTIDVQKSINETNINKNNDIINNSVPTSTETRSLEYLANVAENVASTVIQTYNR